MPNVFRPDERVRGNEFSYRLQVIGRLRDGTSLEQAQAQMDQITARLAAETPRWFEDRVAKVEPLREYLTRGRAHLDAHAPRGGGLRPAHRVREPGESDARPGRARAAASSSIRSALGASRWDLVRALLVESLLLSLGGAALGAFGAWLGVEALRSAIPAEVPARRGHRRRSARAGGDASGRDRERPDLQRRADSSVLAAGAGAAVTQLMRATRPPTRRRTSGCAARSSPLEVALAVVLLVGSGLFLASFARVIERGSRHRSAATS